MAAGASRACHTVGGNLGLERSVGFPHAIEANLEIGREAKALDESDGAGFGLGMGQSDFMYSQSCILG